MHAYRFRPIVRSLKQTGAIEPIQKTRVSSKLGGAPVEPALALAEVGRWVGGGWRKVESRGVNFVTSPSRADRTVPCTAPPEPSS